MMFKEKIRDKYEAAKKIKRDMENGLSDKVVDGAAMTLRSDVRFLNRWKEYCGVDKWDDIDYSNPCVYIEWAACDISILNLCDDADAFIEATKCDRETFLRYYWPKGHGEP